MLTIMCMMFGLSACGGGTASEGDSDSSSKKETIKIEEIDWKVEEGVVNNKRYVLLDYTNNSKFPILSFEMMFKEKKDVSDEEKTSFYEDIKKEFELSDEDIDDIKSKDISASSELKRVLEPGESVKGVKCRYYDGIFDLENINHYNLTAPDIAVIKYIDNETIFTINYDFVSKKYNMDEETEKAFNWSKTELGNKIPKPDVKVVESGRDDETFMFDAFGLSLEQFNAYVEECKELGFTIDERIHEGFFSADNTEGYNVYLNYEADEKCMSGIVELSEDNEKE